MIKIGDFAKIFSVSIKTVRFYEEKGLLHPREVDIYSGYRYYDEQNIEEIKKDTYFEGFRPTFKRDYRFRFYTSRNR